jgi:transposase
METRRLVDMLPDREAETFAAWLRAHPGTEVICRDRGSAYARAAREAAPAAVQVADRFHLWQDLAGAVEKTVIAALAALSPPPAAPAQDSPSPGGVPGEGRLVARHRERYAAVQALRGQGLPVSEIARRLGLDPGTAAKFAHAASLAEILARATSRTSILDPWKPYLGQRWNQGITSAPALHQEIRALGWTGSSLTVSRYLRQFRTTTSPGQPPAQLTAPETPPLPRPRKVTGWIMTRPGKLPSGHAADLARLLDASPALAATAAHVRAFADMMTRRQGLLALEGWLTAIEASDQPALHSLARGLRRDQEAVTAGLALHWSSGPVEGRNCKIKYLKRLMYGRANFDLLRKMALHN